jgi:hypothetical protein
MSLSTQGFTRLGTIKVPALGTGVTAGSAPLLIKNADFTTAMIAALKSDGGDLRLSSDSPGNTQRPIEIVDGLNIIWTLVASVAVDTLIYVWGDKPAATQPAASAAFGRNAVWVDNDRRFHFEQDPSTSDMVDSSGTQDGVRVGAFSSGDRVSGAIGSALKFTRATNYLTSGVVSSPANQPKTVSLITQLRSLQTTTQGGGIFSVGKTSTDTTPSILLAARNSQLEVYDIGSYVTISTPATLTTYKIDYVYDGTNTTAYINGAQAVSYPSNNGISVSGVNLYINGGYFEPAGQTLSEFEYSDYAKTADQISIEYQNQLTAGAWWIATDEPSGGAIDVTPATNNSLSISNNPAIIYNSVLNMYPGAINSSSIALTPEIQYNSLLNLTPATINTSSIALNPAIQYSAAINITSDVINSSSVALTPVIQYISVISLTPDVINTSSISLDPNVEYKAVINLSPSTVQSFSEALNPTITSRQTQNISNITASFAQDLYSVKYKLSGITVNFKG